MVESQRGRIMVDVLITQQRVERVDGRSLASSCTRFVFSICKASRVTMVDFAPAIMGGKVNDVLGKPLSHGSATTLRHSIMHQPSKQSIGECRAVIT